MIRRRTVIVAALAGGGVFVVRALAPRLHDRMMAGCERMFERMPEQFPPKRMMRGIEETRSNTVRILEVLERRERANEEPVGEVSASEAVGHAA